MKWVVFLCYLGTAFAHAQKNSVKHHTKNGPTAAKVEGRIAGGKEVDTIIQYPYVVQISVFSGAVMCAGAIISKDYILTSGYCVNDFDADDNVVRAGNVVYGEGIRIIIEQAFIHPDLDHVGNNYDIAYMKTVLPIEFGEDIQPVALGADYFFQVVVTGWGRRGRNEATPQYDVLRKMDLDVVDFLACKQEYRTNFYVTDRMFCAAPYERTDEGACEGDEGAPAVSDIGLVGLFTYGKGCGPGMLPSVFIDLTDPEIRSFIIECTGVY